MRSGKIKVWFNSAPVEFKSGSVVLKIEDRLQEIANDFVQVFAGGTPPNDFLKKIDVQFASADLTQTASAEIEQAKLANSMAAR